jgi:hypothetical protein
MQGATPGRRPPEPHPSQTPSPGGGAKDVIPSIAQRYVVSEPTVRHIYDCLRQTGGTACQFDIPEFGGRGQWMPGMVMTADPSDRDLQAKIDGLCCELAAIVRGSDTAAPASLCGEREGPTVVGTDLVAGESWWPASFGRPAASGEQCGIRYAYFPSVRRLLLQQGARVDAYDTGHYAITGIAQQQGAASSITFTSNRGPVALDQLQCVPLA